MLIRMAAVLLHGFIEWLAGRPHDNWLLLLIILLVVFLAGQALDAYRQRSR